MRSIAGVLSLLLMAICVYGQSSSSGEFPIGIRNESRSKLFCRFSDLINEPIGPGQDLVIRRPVSAHSLPGYLFIYFTDSGNERNNGDRPIRIIYNSVAGRYIDITPDGKVVFHSNASEKYLEQYSAIPSAERTYRFVDSMIRKHPDDPASADIICLRLLATKVPVDTIDRFYHLLSGAAKASRGGIEIAEYMKGRKALAVNAPVANFIFRDTAGTQRSLADIKSEYVLLDFWFSRCGPCLESFPDLINLYGHTNRRKFEIVGISIDQVADTALWKHTIQANHIPWICLLDPGYRLSYHAFSIDTYPTTVLLDRNRRIVRIDPGIAEITKVLGETKY